MAEERNSLAGRLARYANVGTGIGGAAARIAAGRLLGAERGSSEEGRLIAAALVVAFRTNATLPQGLLVVSTILGGVYFPTTVLPPVVAPLAEWLPLTPGLRALRQSLLLGHPVSAIIGDLGRLAGLTALCVIAGVVAMRWSFAYARRAGSLSQY